MAVKVSKTIEITVSGDDAETLKDICELARVRIVNAEAEHGPEFIPQYIGFTEADIKRVKELMSTIFDV